MFSTVADSNSAPTYPPGCARSNTRDDSMLTFDQLPHFPLVPGSDRFATGEDDVVRRPYRLIVFGPGGLGSVCIWEAAQSPAFELVGVRAYTEAKNGVDA